MLAGAALRLGRTAVICLSRDSQLQKESMNDAWNSVFSHLTNGHFSPFVSAYLWSLAAPGLWEAIFS